MSCPQLRVLLSLACLASVAALCSATEARARQQGDAQAMGIGHGAENEVNDAEHSAEPRVISRGSAAGPYQAFPDACRAANGDIIVVFYAAYAHVPMPNERWPKGGWICMVRSSDEGRTWTEPEAVYDDEHDNRDPHIAQLSDGVLVCGLFSLYIEDGAIKGTGAQIVRSRDAGMTWEKSAQVVCPGYGCSAPVRGMADGTCVLGVYYEGAAGAWGGVIRSTDMAKTWSDPIPVGKGSGLYLDAETDVIRLEDGRLYAALRGGGGANMHFATSADAGLTWTPVEDIGFRAHCPHLNRLTSGEILLSVRLPDTPRPVWCETSLFASRDECRTWQGPFQLDTVGGAHPATVELDDGSVLAVYYEEGEGSAVRARRFCLAPDGISFLPL